MIKTAKRWMTRRNEGGLMPLLFALCALFALAPGQASALESDAWRSLTPAHIAAFVLFAAPESESEAVAVTPQKAALLLSLWRQCSARTSNPDQPIVESALASSGEQSTLHSVATSHFAARTSVLAHRPTTNVIPPSVPTLLAHEAAFLSGVRTNRRLF